MNSKHLKRHVELSDRTRVETTERPLPDGSTEVTIATTTYETKIVWPPKAQYLYGDS